MESGTPDHMQLGPSAARNCSTQIQQLYHTHIHIGHSSCQMRQRASARAAPQRPAACCAAAKIKMKLGFIVVQRGGTRLQAALKMERDGGRVQAPRLGHQLRAQRAIRQCTCVGLGLLCGQRGQCPPAGHARSGTRWRLGAGAAPRRPARRPGCITECMWVGYGVALRSARAAPTCRPRSKWNAMAAGCQRRASATSSAPSVRRSTMCARPVRCGNRRPVAMSNRPARRAAPAASLQHGGSAPVASSACSALGPAGVRDY